MKRSVRLMAAMLISAVFFGAVQAYGEQGLPDDPRLNQTANVNVVHMTLNELAKSLTEQSGVSVKAGADMKDWKVRQRAVSIYTSEASLRTVLEETARLLDFDITPSGVGDERVYTFTQNSEALDREKKSAQTAAQAEQERVMKLRRISLDAAVRAAKLAPTEATKQRTTSPMTAFLGGTKHGRAIANIISYFDSEARDELIKGTTVDRQVDELPERIRQSIREASDTPVMLYEEASSPEEAKARAKKKPKYEISAVLIEPLSDARAPLTPFELKFLGIDESDKSGLQGIPSAVMAMPLTDPGSMMGKFTGRVALALEEGKDPDPAMKQMETDWEKPGLAAEYFGRGSATEKNRPTDPELTAEVTYIGIPTVTSFNPVLDAAEVGLAVEAISNATGFTVMLESFDELNSFATLIPREDTQICRVLAGIEKAGYICEKGERTLRIRPDDWALRRSCEIPASLVSRYVKKVKSGKLLTLDDYARIASMLTEDQMVHGLPRTRLGDALSSDVYGKESGTVRDALRLYGSLTAEQKAETKTENGLSLHDLSKEQSALVSKILEIESNLPKHAIEDGFINVSTRKDIAYTADIEISVLPDSNSSVTKIIYMLDKDALDLARAEWQIEDDGMSFDDTTDESGSPTEGEQP